MRKLAIGLGALGCVVLASGEARAANCATLQIGAPTTISGWNPLNNGTGTATFTVTATREASGVRGARVLFLDNETGSPTKVGSAGPQYEIIDANNVVVSAPGGTTVPTTNTNLQFTWGSGQNSSNTDSKTFTVRVLPSASSDWTSGTPYSESLKYSIQCFGQSSPMGSFTNVAANTISLSIPSLLAITTSGPYQVNFQSFTSATSSVNIGLKSTSSIDVAVSTTNGSKMVTGASPYPANSTIPYTMALNGTTISSAAIKNLTRAGVGGATWPLTLTLTEGAPVSGKVAGTYSDTIQLTLTPGL